jgi:hypothetical protein
MNTTARPRRNKRRQVPATEAPPETVGFEYDQNRAHRVVLIKDGRSLPPAEVRLVRVGPG